LDHLNAKDFLRRDVHNIVNYFKKYNIRADEQEIFDKIVKKKKN
jgi:serine/threonine-protein kinase RIO1